MWGGWGRLAARQLESQGPQRGVCLGPRQESPRERLCWSTSSAGSHTGGTLGPTCASRSTALLAGSADSAPCCALLSHRPAPRRAGPTGCRRRANSAVTTPVPGQSPQTRQGRVTRGGGRGLCAGSASYGLKSPRKTERKSREPSLEGAGTLRKSLAPGSLLLQAGQGLLPPPGGPPALYRHPLLCSSGQQSLNPGPVMSSHCLGSLTPTHPRHVHLLQPL